VNFYHLVTIPVSTDRYVIKINHDYSTGSEVVTVTCSSDYNKATLIEFRYGKVPVPFLSYRYRYGSLLLIASRFAFSTVRNG
jgi:hypothetical protein